MLRKKRAFWEEGRKNGELTGRIQNVELWILKNLPTTLIFLMPVSPLNRWWGSKNSPAGFYSRSTRQDRSARDPSDSAVPREQIYFITQSTPPAHCRAAPAVARYLFQHRQFSIIQNAHVLIWAPRSLLLYVVEIIPSPVVILPCSSYFLCETAVPR